MVSRRSVRIKVMQLLYSLNRDESLGLKEILSKYDDSVTSSYELYLFNLYVFVETIKTTESDQAARLTKHRPSEKDKIFTPILITNPLSQSLVNNEILSKHFEDLKFVDKVDPDIIKKIYYAYAQTDTYHKYFEGEPMEHIDVLLDLFRFMRQNDNYVELMEDLFINWFDDKSLAIGSMKKTIKMLPAKEHRFYKQFKPDKETAEDYGKELLRQVFVNNEELLDLIKPTLKNWDFDRLAVIDMLLLKMALAEFMYFPTIPTKVTLNEYVEIAKQYSTPKSKDFINGILDKLMKEMEAEGKIRKEGRGLMT